MTHSSSAHGTFDTLERDLTEIFGGRLQSLVRYGSKAALLHTLAVVDSLTAADLAACAARVAAWHDEHLATPLVLPATELQQSLDVFPFELSAIIADHVVLSGRNPFAGLRVEPSDLRWACEVQARSHLLHLREGYIEARGRDDALSVLIVNSAPAWASLQENIGRLEHKTAVTDEVTRLVGVKEISNEEASRIFPKYLQDAERLTQYVDGWTAK
ncbi:MAG TPA: hypothetical protein VN628_12595 [Vicinamibacterales bacterium]|nr:hypothetical protein [Vicinamibacterales bacterium]